MLPNTIVCIHIFPFLFRCSYNTGKRGNDSCCCTITSAPIRKLSLMSSSRKIYTDLLLSKELGYPLYYPEPYRNALRRGWSGVSIGDVGIINSDGGFDFQFNVIKKPDVLPDPTSDESVSVANGLPLHAELSFRNGLSQFHPILLEETEIRYNDNDCHPGKVIGKYISHTISLDGKMLVQFP